MTNEELIKRLRHGEGWPITAADRIEELVKERDGYLAERNKFKLYLQRTHADLELEVAAVDALSGKLTKAVEALRETTQMLSRCTFIIIRIKGQYFSRQEVVDKANAVLAELEVK